MDFRRAGASDDNASAGAAGVGAGGAVLGAGGGTRFLPPAIGLAERGFTPASTSLLSYTASKENPASSEAIIAAVCSEITRTSGRSSCRKLVVPEMISRCLKSEHVPAHANGVLVDLIQ